MCGVKWLAIILIVGLIIILLLPKKSNFVFSNADYQYSNPSSVEESGYYKCIFEECGDISNPSSLISGEKYQCLERCKYKQFHLPGDEGIRDRICDSFPEGSNGKWNCLNNIYKKNGYNV